ncbi:hypothetical protein OGAPHI_006592 [Ogataea philodendri]|uniref:Uncharacterized protein n=1 Tax=Ogataea philodendri TaxID=1378263 RepID=A0A9P8NWS9_9ASCO|nr:uncharacterized protein OGAPHI_006592 [Ogataea philodendri]KAH3661185.1 hypothetical protein OGAPHI_006592 [Ogataea philodendri]
MSYYTTNYGGDTQNPSQMNLNAQQQTSLASLLANAAAAQQQQQQSSLVSPGQLYNNNSNLGGAGPALSTSNSSTASSTYQSLLLSSPQTSVASLYSTQRARFMSSKGFDLEDDMEFCPEIVHVSGKSKFNPYTSQTFSPHTSPEALPHAQTSPQSPSVSSMTPRPSTPRVKKVLEIVNPHTGVKISQNNVSVK